MFKLLIADDESIIRRGIKKLIPLEDLGITTVYEAEDGEEALQIIKDDQPDILLLDINMPKLDGLSLAEEIKDTHQDTYIIILTGYDYFEYMQKAIRAKVDDYILKPVSKKDIEFILQTAITKIKEKRQKDEIKALMPEEVDMARRSDLIEDYLDKNMFQTDLSLNQMAEAIGYNSNYLSVLVKDYYGMSFQDYINKQRMEKAKLLLLSSDKKNYEIAHEIGIEDVNYFITKFKKYYQITPKQFRQGKK
ncbi:response regulator transcription factor [Facklamia miroungae]|uniref:Two-component system, response regulator YesN n=1 Tax=Facklamia miroungae TaxID=120956 RepID=A0A1G7T850_9LACT|nr:response regulator [Facklamia miroungae]NKZ29705.1 response regulator [Facklamia miroungae]SDG31411.1 two-component system, response regulator YesN [Facklamia miroungae]